MADENMLLVKEEQSNVFINKRITGFEIQGSPASGRSSRSGSYR